MNIHHRALLVRLVPTVDRTLALAGSLLLLILIFAASRANIAADSIDYYAILAKLTSPAERPIVRNLHFVEQRSPGYPLAALVPYALLDVAVEPLVSTETVAAPSPAESFAPPRGLPSTSAGEPGASPQPGSAVGSEYVLIPPEPLLLRQVPFRDFYVPSEDSWFRWKPVLALATTSYLLLFLGLAATARALYLLHPSLPGYGLIPVMLFTSPVFIRNILDTPLYATLTAFGASSLFLLLFVTSQISRTRRDLILAGACLGFLILARLELGIFAAALAVVFLARREWEPAVLILAGAVPAAFAWALYNQALFGAPLHLGVLRGDINVIAFDLAYIFDSLLHPSSGMLFWSPLLTLGLVVLVFSRSTPLRILGSCSFVLVALYLVRVPVMYGHVGDGLINIGGIAVSAPSSQAEMRELVRSDINRYVTVLMPAAVLGLRDGAGRVHGWWHTRRELGENLTSQLWRAIRSR
ncbi:MAG: hypothetical protein MUO38_15605 [Anaerolineales bacterium]|nr:hypothetical protein [Anaerolineales bacterium]